MPGANVEYCAILNVLLCSKNQEKVKKNGISDLFRMPECRPEIPG